MRDQAPGSVAGLPGRAVLPARRAPPGGRALPDRSAHWLHGSHRPTPAAEPALAPGAPALDLFAPRHRPPTPVAPAQPPGCGALPPAGRAPDSPPAPGVRAQTHESRSDTR